MADKAFNIAKGRHVELALRVNGNDPSTSVLYAIALKTVEADATLIRRATVAAVLAGGSVEATNSGYARIALTDTDLIVPAVDNVNDRYDIQLPDLSWPGVAAAGGAWAAILIAYAPIAGGADSTLVPLTKHDFVTTPDGSTTIVATDPAAGFFGAT